jgi:AcrR family transcriptional regulator
MTERRHGVELENALLDAAWDELVENGYANLRMDAVAARAQTSRPVLYRRWPDRHLLVRAAIAHVLNKNAGQAPDTGSLRGDILAVMRSANATRIQFATVLGVHLGGFYQETGTSPADLRTSILNGRRTKLDTIYDRAIARGEIDAGLSDRMKSLPFDLLRHELLMTLAPVPDAALVEIVDTLFLPIIRSAAKTPRDQ